MAKWCLAHSKVTLVMMNILHCNSRLARFRIDIALDKRWPCHIESAGCLITMSSAIPQLDFCKPVFPYPIAVILSWRLSAIFWIVGSAMSIWERNARIINEVTLYVYQKVKWMNQKKNVTFTWPCGPSMHRVREHDFTLTSILRLKIGNIEKKTVSGDN